MQSNKKKQNAGQCMKYTCCIKKTGVLVRQSF